MIYVLVLIAATSSYSPSWIKSNLGTILLSCLGFYYIREILIAARNNQQRALIQQERMRLSRSQAVARQKNQQEHQRRTRLAATERQRRENIAREQRLHALRIENIDTMDGIKFEHYVCRLLEHQGYKAKVTPRSGDFGVDIVAENGERKYAIQVKRQSANVSRRAISDAVAGRIHYGCNNAMVITNQYFTKDAKTFAVSSKCALIDRDTLTTRIMEFQKGR